MCPCEDNKCGDTVVAKFQCGGSINQPGSAFELCIFCILRLIDFILPKQLVFSVDTIENRV
jgi:hypothetical protein